MRSDLTRVLARSLWQTLHHLAIFAVMLLALAPHTASFWQCEGQQCGPLAWVCCCTQPDDSWDANCGSLKSHSLTDSDPLVDGHLAEAGLNSSDCHCSVVVQDGEQPLRSTSFAFVTPVQFVVEPVFAYLPQPTHEVESPRPNLSRGPPPDSVFFALPSLRGPPIA